MPYKTIAVYLARPDSVSRIMRVALPLAERFGAHLIGLHVAPGVPIMGTIGAQVPAEVIEQYVEVLNSDAKAIEKKFTSAVKDAKAQSEWRGQNEASLETDILGTIAGQSRCADLVIMGQNESDDYVGELAADVVLAAGRPVMIVPAKGDFGDPSGHITVGWDGSREAARAAFDALPLLKKAKAVSIVSVGKDGAGKNTLNQSGAQLTHAFARHGVKAEAVTIDKSDASAGEALLAYISERDSDLLVMGCYSHSRLRERLFGGASYKLLHGMIVPVLMSH